MRLDTRKFLIKDLKNSLNHTINEITQFNGNILGFRSINSKYRVSYQANDKVVITSLITRQKTMLYFNDVEEKKLIDELWKFYKELVGDGVQNNID